MRGRIRLHWLPTVRRRIALNGLAVLGAVVTLGEAIKLPMSDDPAWLAWTQIALVVVGLVLAVRASLPHEQVELIHHGSHIRLCIERGDLLDVADEPIVVTLNQHLEIAERVVSSRSLVRQVVHRWFGGDDTAVRAALGVSFNEPGRAEPVPVGTTIAFQDGACRVVFVAVARRDPDTRSSVLIDDIWHALTALWAHARREGYERINVPVIGAGLSNARISPASLLMLLIGSFASAAQEQHGLCPLRIMLYGRPAEDIGLLELAVDYCHKLGFRTAH